MSWERLKSAPMLPEKFQVHGGAAGRKRSLEFGRKTVKMPRSRATGLAAIRQRGRSCNRFAIRSEMAEHKKHIAFEGRILILGFCAVGQGTLPLMLRHIDMPRENVSIITAEDWGREIAQEYGVTFRVEPLTRDNYVRILDRELK